MINVEPIITDDTAAKYSPEIPEPIIQLIQSLLDPKHAAQTTLVSKSWYWAWSTRPTIDLDESHFPIDHLSPYLEVDRLPEFAEKTFRRYEDQNLRIDTFILSLRSKWYYFSGLPTKWTSKALKLGATNFTFRFEHDVEIPNVVRRLYLEEASVHRPKVIRCMGLKSLSLNDTRLKGCSFFDIIACLPLSNVVTDFEDQGAAGSTIILPNLTSLILCGNITWEIQGVFLDNLSSKFPNLKNLTLNLPLPLSFDAAVVSSGSVEILNLRADGNYCAKLEIDVPRIRKFTFEGSVMPKFSVGSKSGDRFESRVSLISHEGLRADWLYKLGTFDGMSF